MRRAMVGTLALFTGLAALAVLAGCESTGASGQHGMAAQAGTDVMGCQLCYDEAKRVTRDAGPGAKWKRHETIKKHMCPGCETEMTVYTEDGVPMVKCAKCAPAGVACDRCKPPKAE